MNHLTNQTTKQHKGDSLLVFDKLSHICRKTRRQQVGFRFQLWKLLFLQVQLTGSRYRQALYHLVSLSVE